MNLNHILEVANIDNIIDRAALSVFMAWFLVTEFWGVDGHYSESRIVLPDVRKWAIYLGVAIFLWATGAEVLTFGVNLWRDHAMVLGVWLMLFGSVGTVGGNILLLRTLSVQRCGQWLWVVVALVNVGYTAAALMG